MPSLVRPRLAAFAPRCIRLFSASHRRPSGQFTISIAPASSKKSVLDELHSRRHALAERNTTSQDKDNAAVVLASPEFATWLEDESFMSGLLQGLPLSKESEGVSVLAAVVAALALSTSSQSSTAGFSIAYGNTDRLLPTIWSSDASDTTLRGSRGSIGSDIDKDAAITVEVPPLSTSTSTGEGRLRVTLPLANTIFQNGRRSTLLASRWAWKGDELSLASTIPHEHDLIRPSVSSSTPSTVSAVLFPIAEPLTIAAGLGNIVRQVYGPEDYTKKIPAARELEAAIPALLKTRKRSDPTLQDGAMSVWALVVPVPLVLFYEKLKEHVAPALDSVSDSSEHTADAEQQAAALTSQHFTTLLAAGCRLHKILSGGGGWGLKQGLLSLDPQTSHPLSEKSGDNKILGEQRSDDEMDDEAMQTFIRSFKSKVVEGAEAETEAEGVDGVAIPGAVVQFFVAPLEGKTQTQTQTQTQTEKTADADTEPQSITLGAQIGYNGSEGLSKDSTTATTFYYNHFGAVSHHGIFLASDSLTGAVRTKLDAPNSHVSCRG